MNCSRAAGDWEYKVYAQRFEKNFKNVDLRIRAEMRSRLQCCQNGENQTK